jgi:hypothetical protein
MTFAAVRRLGLSLPDVTTGTIYRSPALKVKGRMFACLAIHRSAEPHTLVVRLPFGKRDQLVADKPGTYYLTDHYVDYPCVLIRLGRCSDKELKERLAAGHAFMASGAKVTPRRRRGAKR